MEFEICPAKINQKFIAVSTLPYQVRLTILSQGFNVDVKEQSIKQTKLNLWRTKAIIAWQALFLWTVMGFLDGNDDASSAVSQQTSAAKETIKTSAKAAATSKASADDNNDKATSAVAAITSAPQTSKAAETSVATAATSETLGSNSSNGVADTVSTCVNQGLDSAGCRSGRAANEGAIIGGEPFLQEVCWRC